MSEKFFSIAEAEKFQHSLNIFLQEMHNFVSGATQDPKSFREAFASIKSDPSMLAMYYHYTGVSDAKSQQEQSSLETPSG